MGTRYEAQKTYIFSSHIQCVKTSSYCYWVIVCYYWWMNPFNCYCCCSTVVSGLTWLVESKRPIRWSSSRSTNMLLKLLTGSDHEYTQLPASKERALLFFEEGSGRLNVVITLFGQGYPKYHFGFISRQFFIHWLNHHLYPDISDLHLSEVVAAKGSEVTVSRVEW